MPNKKQTILAATAVLAVVAIAFFVSGSKDKRNDAKVSDSPSQQSTNSQSTMQNDKSDFTNAPAEGYVPKIDGVAIEVSVEGSGDKVVKKGDTLSVHYTGTLENGTVFDSSVPRKEPFSFRIGQGMVIRGWDEGLIGMKVGEKRKLTISPEMGYGDQAIGSIPANSTLIFEVELLSIK